MQTHHSVARDNNPDVVLGEALQQGELPRAIKLVDNHRCCDSPFELGGLQAHQGAGAGELQGQRQLMGQGLLGLLLQDAQQTSLFPQAAALLFVVLEVFPGDIRHRLAQQLQLLAQFSDARLILGQIESGQVAPKAPLHQLLGLVEVVAGQQIEHHPVAGHELTHQRIGRTGSQLTGLPDPLKTALHRHHVALGVEPAAAGAASHLQKFTGHQRPMPVLGALGERGDHRGAGRHVDASGEGFSGKHHFHQTGLEELFDQLLPRRQHAGVVGGYTAQQGFGMNAVAHRLRRATGKGIKAAA